MKFKIFFSYSSLQQTDLYRRSVVFDGLWEFCMVQAAHPTTWHYPRWHGRCSTFVGIRWGRDNPISADKVKRYSADFQSRSQYCHKFTWANKQQVLCWSWNIQRKSAVLILWLQRYQIILIHGAYGVIHATYNPYMFMYCLSGTLTFFNNGNSAMHTCSVEWTNCFLLQLCAFFSRAEQKVCTELTSITHFQFPFRMWPIGW